MGFFDDDKLPNPTLPEPPAPTLPPPAPKPTLPVLWPIGRHKDEPVDIVQATDPGYVDWAMSQDWFGTRYQAVYNYVINGGSKPVETPEHNALQARFVDADFRLAVLRAVAPRWEPLLSPVKLARKVLEERVSERQAQLNRSLTWAQRGFEVAVEDEISTRTVPKDLKEAIARSEKLIEEATAAPMRQVYAADLQRYLAQATPYRNGTKHRKAWKELGKAKIQLKLVKYELEEFNEELEAALAAFTAAGGTFTFDIEWETEVKGWDIVLEVDAMLNGKTADRSRGICIELKPALGGDYPETLRQMKTNRTKKSGHYNVLIFDRFTASAVTLDQVRAMFKASDFTVLALDEILGVLSEG
jgi:hypothetical protein